MIKIKSMRGKDTPIVAASLSRGVFVHVDTAPWLAKRNPPNLERQWVRRFALTHRTELRNEQVPKLGMLSDHVARERAERANLQVLRAD